MSLTIHYATGVDFEIQTHQFKRPKDADHFVASIPPTENSVWLYAVEEEGADPDCEILITRNWNKIRNHLSKNIVMYFRNKSNVFLQEYFSYEEAYEVALDMREGSDLQFEASHASKN